MPSATSSTASAPTILRRARLMTTSELAQEADVVLEEQPDLRHAVARHGDALESHAEREAGELLGVVAHRLEDVGVHHAGAEQLAPARSLAHRAAAFADAARPVADRTGDVELATRLDEREVHGHEPGPDLRSIDGAREHGERALEVGH